MLHGTKTMLHKYFLTWEEVCQFQCQAEQVGCTLEASVQGVLVQGVLAGLALYLWSQEAEPPC
jgi:hypothetical protein